jgi:DNA-directed RNA polymerase subunit L
MSTAGKTIAQLRAERAGRTGARASVAPAARVPADSVFKNVRGEPGQPEVLRFQLAPTHVSYANTLRRIMTTEVETVAFRADIQPNGATSDISISRNSTPMSNEMLAHRVGLIPIYVDRPLEWKADQYTFKLDITNDSGEPRDITAADIEVYQDRGPEEEPLRLPNVNFFHPDPISRETTLITVLKGRIGAQEPESLTFTAKATVGTGRENARFMPVTSRCSYGYTLDDDPERRKEFFNKWLTTYKKGNPSELEGAPEKKAQLEREFNTMEVQRCYKVNERGEPYSFDFVVESVGVLSPRYIVARALDILVTKLLRFASIDTGDLPEGLKVLPAEARGPLFDFVFQREDHTLGNLLQTWMDQTQMDDGTITFVGYKVPHPLRDEMVLRVGVQDGRDLSARAAVARAAREAAQMFRDWSASWTAIPVV